MTHTPHPLMQAVTWLHLGYMSALLAHPPAVLAQSSNGTTTLVQDVVSAAGGQIGGGNPMRMQTVVGLPAGGRMTNGTFTLLGGLGSLESTRWMRPITTTIAVTGTVDDPLAEVTVNGIPASVAPETLIFRAEAVPLVLGPNTLTAVARDRLDNASFPKSIRVWLDVPPTLKTPSGAIPVRLRCSEFPVSVDVNGAPVTCDPITLECTASVRVVLGYNTLTATARDNAGNPRSVSIGIFVIPPTRPPARPTVGTFGPPPPEVTTEPTVTFGGTKIPGTSIWICAKGASASGGNCVEVVPVNDETTWSVTRDLVEGDNLFVIVAKDAAGVMSASVILNIILDREPPVIRSVTYLDPDGNPLRLDAATSLPKTNFGTVVIRGEVDDSLTVVTIHGQTDHIPGRIFEAGLPLGLGSNPLNLVARGPEPNNFVTTQILQVLRGALPLVTGVQPADRAKAYAGEPVTIQVEASDPDGDALLYQIQVDGALLLDHSPVSSQPWTPGLSQFGVRPIEVRVQDGFGGVASKQIEVYVVRKPINPP